MQMELGEEFWPKLDRDLTKGELEKVFFKYRINKFVAYQDREAKTTSSPEAREFGPTNVTSDQTAMTAISNVDTREARIKYCEKVERVVNKLPRMERTLLHERYMSEESEYLKDSAVYAFKFDPPIGETLYYKIRWKAFYKIAFGFDELKIMDIRKCIKSEADGIGQRENRIYKEQRGDS